MAYRFNGGQGGVTCDACNKLIDAGLSLKEYEGSWEKSGDDGDFCMACKMVGKHEESREREEAMAG